MILLTRRRKGEKRSEAETLEFDTFGEAKQAAFGFKHVYLRCDSCQAVTINGMICHETGCPHAAAERQREAEEEAEEERRWLDEQDEWRREEEAEQREQEEAERRCEDEDE